MENLVMDDKQLGVLYTIMLTIWMVAVLGLSHLLDNPKTMTFEEHADQVCQELYGPQTGHKWVDAAIMCETVRGELLAVRKP
jgi:hypothetical protein